MELKQALEQFGLEGRKADVYLAALELGGTTVIEIAKKSGVKRTTCYDILLDLIKKGLISETVKGKKRFYIGEDPEKIQKELQKKEDLFSEILPQLKSIHNTGGQKPKIRFYEGKEGLREVYAETLNFPGEILAAGGEETVKAVGHEWISGYIKRRIEKGIHVRGIVAKSAFIEKEYISKDQEQLRMSKLVDSNNFPFPVEINIYGHQRVNFVSPHDQIAVVVESGEIYKAMKSMFELIWDNLPEIKK